MRMKVPVLLIFFNRGNEVQQVIDAVRKYAPEKMYLASDGGRTEKEHQKVLKIREKVKKCIDWNCQLKCLFSDKNLGCQWGPVTAINWVFKNENRCIILEDDCVPDVSFFGYCEQLLERYEDNESVWMISGENYLDDDSMFENSDYTFSLRTDTWGWATWKRAWERCDFCLRSWPIYKKGKCLSHTYYMKYYDELEYMTKQLDNIYRQKDKTIWDYQWRFHMIINNGLCIVPRRNLIKNIGWGKTATHTKERSRIYDVSVGYLNTPLHHAPCVVANADFDRKYGELLFWEKLRAQREAGNMRNVIKMLWERYFGRYEITKYRAN